MWQRLNEELFNNNIEEATVEQKRLFYYFLCMVFCNRKATGDIPLDDAAYGYYMDSIRPEGRMKQLHCEIRCVLCALAKERIDEVTRRMIFDYQQHCGVDTNEMQAVHLNLLPPDAKNLELCPSVYEEIDTVLRGSTPTSVNFLQPDETPRRCKDILLYLLQKRGSIFFFFFRTKTKLCSILGTVYQAWIHFYYFLCKLFKDRRSHKAHHAHISQNLYTFLLAAIPKNSLPDDVVCNIRVVLRLLRMKLDEKGTDHILPTTLFLFQHEEGMNPMPTLKKFDEGIFNDLGEFVQLEKSSPYKNLHSFCFCWKVFHFA